ncbi:MAG: PQQ-dependent sugar dehydrogenase [Planctomycetota bacterium]
MWRLIKLAAVFVIAFVVILIGTFFLLQADPPVGPVTPTGATPLDTGWKLVEVTGGLEHPWAATWLPDDAGVLITERPGRIRLFADGKLVPTPLTGVPPVVTVDQGGLMDLKLHPDFASNRLVYFTASTGSEKSNRTTLFRATLSDDRTALNNLEELYRVSRDKSGGQHFGSVLAWLPDGSLLMSIGDGGNPPISLDGQFIRRQSQNKQLAFGKVLRMTDDGQPHPDNPFPTGAGDAPYVYTFGHRNVQGLAIRPPLSPPAPAQTQATQTQPAQRPVTAAPAIWVTEHGSKGGDELNRLEPGANYGWPLATYSVEYWGTAIADSATLPGALDPHVVWTPALAPSGLAFYTGDAFPAWRGDLLAGGLVAQQIRRIHFNDQGEIDGQTTLQLDRRIRWVGVGPDAGLYILTDSPTGGLYRIEPN